MKKWNKILIVFLIASVMTSLSACGTKFEGEGYNEYYVTEDSADTVTVMSYNIRYNTREYWKTRVRLIGEGIEKVSPDLIGMQEVVMERQLDALTDAVGDGYGRIAYGRDEHDKGEACVIFYKKSRFELLDEGVFWLSETPDRVSRYTGAGHNRTAAFAKLRDKVTGVEFVYYNTHLDNSSEQARAFGQNLI